MKTPVRAFDLQPTRSFPDGAPQRESYWTDEDLKRADVRYVEEWRREYTCAGCTDVNCPQCGAEDKK